MISKSKRPAAPPAGPAPDLVDVESMVTDPALQCRSGLKPATVKEYANALRQGAKFPPIDVARVQGVPFVTDGFHRIQAHRDLGFTKIEAFVTDMTWREATLRAAAANHAHGLPLKLSDQRRAFKKFIAAGGHRDPSGKRIIMSYRDIASKLGGARGHTTIRNWMEKDFPEEFSAMAAQDHAPVPPDVAAVPEGLDNALLTKLRGHLKQAASLARGIQAPDHRSEAIRVAKKALAMIETSGPWVPAYDEFDRPVGTDF